MIDKDLAKSGMNGWDGAWYKDWYHAYESFLDTKKLRSFFPTVDSLTTSIGNIALYYQGRAVESCRAGNVTDAYVTNGWESEVYENHSGIVDCWRNPKGDPSLIARYNRPIYIAVKIRNKIAQVPATIVTDFYAVNQVDLRGEYTLRASLVGPVGAQIWKKDFPVRLSGGDVFGQLLAEEIKADTGAVPGY